MGNGSSYYTAADSWVRVAVLGSKQTKRRPGPPCRYCRGGGCHRARSPSIQRPTSGPRESRFIAAAPGRNSKTLNVTLPCTERSPRRKFGRFICTLPCTKHNPRRNFGRHYLY
jgi:hypothetical protein